MLAIPKITLEDIGYTVWERQVMDALIKFRDYRKAARELTKKGFPTTEGNLRGVTFRLRLKKSRVETYRTQYEKDRRALGPNCHYLDLT